MSNQSSEEKDQCHKHTNGLIFMNNYCLPEELISKILEELSPEDRLACRLVCKHWNRIISYLLYDIYNKTFNTHESERLSFDLCYITLFNSRLRKNLLKNVNGEDDFKNWRIISKSGWYIGNPPSDGDVLPEEMEELNGNCSYFGIRSSIYPSSFKEQRIDLSKDKYLSFVIKKYKPSIYVSTWVAAHLRCLATYQMKLIIKCKGKQDTVKGASHVKGQWLGPKWRKLEMIIDDYPDDVEELTYMDNVCFWSGNYNVKMAVPVVKLLLQKPRL